MLKVFFLIFLVSCNAEEKEVKYPETKKDDIQENIFDRNIDDPYRWLEDFNSAEALSWVEQQNKFTDSFIQNKYQKKIKEDLEDIWITSDISIPVSYTHLTLPTTD